LQAALESAGADFSHVVKLGFYFTDISQIAVVREVRDKFVNTATPPASTAVEVRRLFREGILIEVDAVAVLT
jgi:enamine deaminase RidA (YjgF/YER057c/UK114 family)